MEWVCGPFSSNIAAAWVEAIGTVGAAIVAVAIYYKARRDQRRDLEGRRAVLHNMLRGRVAASVSASEQAVEQLRKWGDEVDLQQFLDARWRLNVRLDRLVDFQAQLTQFGEKADAAIAGYIESCRIYAEHLEILTSFVEAIKLGPNDSFGVHLRDLRVAADAMGVRAQAAGAAVGRKVSPGEIKSRTFTRPEDWLEL